MKAITHTLCAAIFACAFASCESRNTAGNQTVFRLEDNPRSNRSGSGARYGYGGTDRNTKPNQPANAGGQNPAGTDPNAVVGNTGGTEILDTPAGTDIPGTTGPLGTGNPTAGTDIAPASSGDGNKPFAKPVAGKFGHVYSPFASGKEVDVTGFPPGTEVHCPYTKNVFRVP